MKKLLLLILLIMTFNSPAQAWCWSTQDSDLKAVEKVLKDQVKYANRTNFTKFIETYDSKYKNSDGFNLEIYSNLIKDVWNTYDKIKYDIEIKNITIEGHKAKVNLTETSFANIEMTEVYKGELKSFANTVYDLEKINGKWKVVSDTVLDETTSMLYGQAKGLDIKLSAPNQIEANKEYCATLEFTPPLKTLAIASIASDIVEYPQKPTKEVFRTLPEDNILERLFTSNNKNANEYIVASIGLTQTSVDDINIKLNLTGFGYTIKRVNVIPTRIGGNNVKTE